MSNENIRTFAEIRDVTTAIRCGLLKVTQIGNQEYYECVVCRRGMTGSVPAEAHMIGSSHLKALRTYSYSADSLLSGLADLNLTPPSSSTRSSRLSYDSVGGASADSSPYVDSDSHSVMSAIKRKIVTQNEVGGIISMCCNICNIRCTGDVSMAQHLKGDAHHKRQRRMTQAELSAFESIPSPSTSEVTSSRLSTSPEIYVDRGSPITRATSQEASIETLSNTDDVEKAIKDGTVTRVVSSGIEVMKCEVCSKSCTGDVPMKQHLESAAHLKKQLKQHRVVTRGSVRI